MPPGYDGPLPEGGYFIAHARTTRVVMLGRMFLENNDPKPTVELIKRHEDLSVPSPAASARSIAEFLTGKTKLGRIEPPPPTVFHEGSGKSR